MILTYNKIVEKLTNDYYMTESTFNDFCNIIERINIFINNDNEIFNIDILLDIENIYQILSLYFTEFVLIKYMMMIIRIAELDPDFNKNIIFEYQEIQRNLVKIKKLYYINKRNDSRSSSILSI
tara:strand:- start:25 stop:396 length:372 start_codon:yes stop_codon:yes gene_type:complete